MTEKDDWGDSEEWSEDVDSWGDEPPTSEAPAPTAAQPVKAEVQVARKPVVLAKENKKEDLLVKYNAEGEPSACCRMVKGPDGKPFQTSPWRVPTADEYNAIVMKAKFVQGGVVSEKLPTSTNVATQMQSTPLGVLETAPSPWKTYLKIGLGVAVIGGVGYLGYKKFKGD